MTLHIDEYPYVEIECLFLTMMIYKLFLSLVTN